MDVKPSELANNESVAANAVTTDDSVRGPTIYSLAIERFRGIKSLSWRPGREVNVILGGGDVGKTTILDAIALLLSPTNSANVPDTDYCARDIGAGFSVEAVLSLPPESGVNNQFKQSWPWIWNGSEAVVPGFDAEIPEGGEPVYRLRVRGTADLELIYEIVQPDGTPDALSVALRRSIGLVRLGGDDRNDRDLRLVHGSALDRLLSDKSLRSRMATQLADRDVRDGLTSDAKEALTALDRAFAEQNLPSGLNLSITGGQGASIASMIGLTATYEGAQLPLVNWGAGTRRLSALAIAEQNQGEFPITVVDEIERGLEPYRQRAMMEKLQKGKSQTFLTTHSPFVIAGGSQASLWYVDAAGQIGPLEGKKIAKLRDRDPGAFLSRLTIVAEGATEVGFVSNLLQRALGSPLEKYGIHVCDGGGEDTTLGVLEALIEARMRFGGFVDNDGNNPTRWQACEHEMGDRLFRWSAGCTEQNIINATPDDELKTLLTDPNDENTGERLRTLAQRLGIEEKDFKSIEGTAGATVRALMIEAATGRVPADKARETSEKKQYAKHGTVWFKTEAGGRELADKVFSMGLWPTLRPNLIPFCCAVRKVVCLPEIADIPP